ncbi:CDP-glycerol glycerophosphotransferase family protein [Campylobacter sp. RM12647]|uniref:CDP-glycerol glycerophosphotransferase family protein n=1 Tax=Campylobacter sp. RM12647 TaxID=2735737 RepID=UPI001D6FF2F1|nr:CDP-glycerol glycerophosphotransferase family protein [Campylobacter sp. RM12647]
MTYKYKITHLNEFFYDFKIKLFKKQIFKLPYKSYSTYTIVSAVYNVEKYLDDFFTSIINQSIGFEKSIQLIMVDDGSSDNSVNIIKRYQKLYPNNITYIYKENGGQASARNLGLKYVKTPWVTFTDPDDFLDKDFFKNIDIEISKNNNLAMVSSNIIFYHEKDNFYKDNHPLNYKYKNKKSIKIKDLDKNIQLSAASAIIKFELIKEFKFDEDLKPCFEDAKFINEYLLDNLEKDAIFIENARYFYRKRVDGNSTLDKKLKDKRYFLDVSSRGYLALLEYTQNELGYIPNFIQQTIIYDVYWMIKELIENYLKVISLAIEEKKCLENILIDIFKYLDVDVIKNSFLLRNNYLLLGVLKKYKNYSEYTNACVLEKYTKKYLRISYYSVTKEDKLEIFINNKKFNIDLIKIQQINLLDEFVIYKKIIYLKEVGYIKNIEVVLNNQTLVNKDKSYYKIKYFLQLGIQYDTTIKSDNFEFMEYINNKSFSKNIQINEAIYQEIRHHLGYKKHELWLFADRKYKANDNAEYLYEYIQKNHPEQKIAFVIDKNSSDYIRLKNKKFNVVSSSGIWFKIQLFKARKIISSHTDNYLLKGIGKYTLFNKDYIFLQHGVTKDNISNWLNSKDISLIITSTTDEYNSIVSDYSDYKLSSKEVVLTGMPRFEKLIEKSRAIKQEKMILIFPTWREYLADKIDKQTYKRKKNDKFYTSLYYQNYKELLTGKELEELCKNNGYKVVFMPHFAMLEYLDDFKLSSFVEVVNMQDIDIQEYLCKASILITDYSSIAFDFALLKKKIIYFQFSEEEYYSHIYDKGYFDYHKHGFGDICANISEVIKILKENLKINF